MEDRFWSKVRPTGFCWEWIAGLDKDGYGRFGLDRTSRMAHRVSWELLMGSLPEGSQIDHLCRNRRCVNPDHLEPVEPVINSRRSSHSTKRHCSKGHEFTESNTRFDRRGRRFCRECAVIASREYRQRKALQQ